jgi:hypothetical protein
LVDAKTVQDIAAEAKIEARRITGQHTPFDFRGSDVQLAREHAEGVLRAMQHVPGGKVKRVATFGPGGSVIVDSTEHDLADAITMPDGTIAFNTRLSGPGMVDSYYEKLADNGLSGWSPSGARDGTYIGIHEYGHVVGNNVTERAQRYADQQAGRQGYEFTDDLVGEEVSQYASSDAHEMVAEAFADVVMNGDSASALSRAIYEMIVATSKKRS